MKKVICTLCAACVASSFGMQLNNSQLGKVTGYTPNGYSRNKGGCEAVRPLCTLPQTSGFEGASKSISDFVRAQQKIAFYQEQAKRPPNQRTPEAWVFRENPFDKIHKK